jgi:hypothetical protein
MVTAVSTTYMIRRSSIPSPIEMSAAPEATPVANGLIVEPIVPTPAPSRMTLAATIRS